MNIIKSKNKGFDLSLKRCSFFILIVSILSMGNLVRASGLTSSITSGVDSASDLVTTVTTTASASDVSSTGSISSGDSDTMLSDANNYIDGNTSGLTELISSLKSTATSALSATASSVGLDSSASSIISGSGDSSGQQDPVSIIEDTLTTVLVNNTVYDCIEYEYLGLCWYMKPHFPWTIGTNNAAENYVDDLQVEVTSRPPSVESTFLDVSDNAPTDLSSGAVLQNAGALFGKVMDELYSYGPDLQIVENESAKSSKDETVVNLFREAMVIGNPTSPSSGIELSVWQELPGYCSSTVTPYEPYFLSTLDIFSWRILSTTDTLILALYSIGEEESWNEIGASMGSVFPRVGYSDSPEEFDTAVTMAYRAISIVSDLRTSYSGVAGLHIGTPTDAYAEDSYTNQSDMKYRTVRDHTSQLLRMTYPEEATTCTNYQSLSKVEKEAKNQKYSTKNKYHSSAFKVYRPYVCCKSKSKYLFTALVLSPKFERY